MPTHPEFVGEIPNGPYPIVSNAASSTRDVKANRHTLAVMCNWGTAVGLFH
ncbi:hypothetical protein [Arthrobacter sp. Rue61a]|uniref:hypothetical protein n=1 Tax=Arthrobacter sp. Rue61a TaxID=1118963 RepID=UPI00027DF219|nr:hypothetical protein [Arthrobacter sp. Rue61a]AFR31102.1 hypothetical protein ARUE_c42300 [Arthrobacter sp. Rue61a]